jgi:predicted small metal-binding protein
MKAMTCAQMGGMCDEKMSASTPDEMMGKGMQHLEAAHPEMAASVKAMAETDPLMVEWNEKFAKTWEETPEDTEGGASM